MTKPRNLAWDYEVGEYYSANLGSRHSSSNERSLGESINFYIRSVHRHQNTKLELVGLSDYMNEGSVRAVFKVVGRYKYEEVVVRYKYEEEGE
jgi:hypothetical protein